MRKFKKVIGAIGQTNWILMKWFYRFLLPINLSIRAIMSVAVSDQPGGPFAHVKVTELSEKLKHKAI